MKRLIKQIFAALIVLSGVTVAALAWVTATTEGARWVLTSVTPPGGSISIQKVEGRMIDHLLLSGIRVTLAQQKIEIDTLELSWKPFLLTAGTVAVRKLLINGVRIRDDAPPDNKPTLLEWPKVSDSAQLFDVMIVQLQVSDISYRRLQEEPLLVTSINCAVNWQNNLLSITDLTAVSPSGKILGGVSAQFKEPSLAADLAIALALPVAGMDQFSLQARRSNSTSAEQLFGNVTIAGSSGGRKLLELSGDVGMKQNAINLQRLHLTSPGRNGLITADGSLAFTPQESLLSLQVKASGLDLAPELNMPTNLSGTLTFAGTVDSYRGNFSFDNKSTGWQEATVAAEYHGTREGMKLAPLTAGILDGSLAGNLEIDWSSGFALRGAISGRNLNPARIDSKWKGVANFNAAGKMARAGNAPLTGSVSGSLLESRLHGQTLTGGVQAEFAGNNLTVSRLALQGKGFDLNASGDLNKRLSFNAQISDLSRLLPGSAGTLMSDGWVRRRSNMLSGVVSASGSELAYEGVQLTAAHLTARLDQGEGYPGHVTITLKDAAYGGHLLNAVTITADGKLPRHTMYATVSSGSSEAEMNLSAGYNAGIWRGSITHLSGRDSSGLLNLSAPAAFALGSGIFSLSPLTLTAGTAERLEIAAELGLKPLKGQLRAQWANLNLARINPYITDVQLTGQSQGTVRLGVLTDGRINLSGNAEVKGTAAGKDGSITLERSLVSFDGSERGLQVGIELKEVSGGRLKGTYLSTAPLLLAMPDKGKVTVEWGGIDMALLQPWLPGDMRVEGIINGRAAGNIIPGRRFELDGTLSISDGMVHKDGPDGGLNLKFPTATASCGWRDDSLSGTLALNMAEYGQARAHFQLPVAARFPVAFDSHAPLQGALVGKLEEQGIFSALFPGFVQKSFGKLDVELGISGTWEEPQVGGTLRLSKAGAYLPTVGIHLREIQLAARLDRNLIRIDSYSALSGPGHIEGNALITLADRQIAEYRGIIRGDKFQTVHLPELRILCSPDLSFEGTLQKLTLRGELRLPELQLENAPSHQVITSSSDVIREGIITPAAKNLPLALDVQIRVILGEQVLVKVAGIDARLGGSLDLSFGSLDKITSTGEIRVVKGRYQTYGVSLEIVRGRLFFAGGPINQPTLDVLALRTIGEVRAGVTVTGSLQKPVAKLYSEPAMPDVDVMSYIVLGNPYENNGEQADLTARAAGALLTSRQATEVQEKLKSRLGLSTLEIQGGVGTGGGSMGYKPLQVTAPGDIPAALQTGITETVLTVGKYLTPKLYLSYGRSLFTGSNLFLLRYDIFKQWQIETQTGNESGADLFYKLEFK